MILAVDTDVLVHWAMEGAPLHRAARRLFRQEIEEREGTLGLTPQVLHEFLHVATDPRRFAHPLPMEKACEMAEALWEAQEVEQILPGPGVLPRTLDLLTRLRLGRKRILDTALAATLEIAGVRQLATLNRGDFEAFAFLDLVSPG